MKTFEQARRLILRHHRPLKKEKVALAEILGKVMAQNLRAPVALPIGDNSAMDGFVLRAKDIQKAGASHIIRVPIRGAIRAGDAPKKLSAHTAMRIMTGAVIPQGGDTVLAKEDAKIENSELVFNLPLVRGRHVRKCGEEMKRGALLELKNDPASAGTLAYLATAGISRAEIFSTPRVAVIVTGSELISPGKKLRFGQIYESNSVMLTAALALMGIQPVMLKRVQDRPALICRALQSALKKADFILLSGGVSVGDYDFSKLVLNELGVQTIFWKVAQKPGKPVYFGKKGQQSFFGIPGNPASAFVCFYEYIYPALRKAAGWRNPFLPRLEVLAQAPIRRDPSKILFLKGRIQNGKLEILRGQGSHMVSALHAANCLAVIPPGNHEIRAGEKVAVDLLPSCQHDLGESNL